MYNCSCCHPVSLTTVHTGKVIQIVKMRNVLYLGWLIHCIEFFFHDHLKINPYIYSVYIKLHFKGEFKHISENHICVVLSLFVGSWCFQVVLSILLHTHRDKCTVKLIYLKHVHYLM